MLATILTLMLAAATTAFDQPKPQAGDAGCGTKSWFMAARKGDTDALASCLSGSQHGGLTPKAVLEGAAAEHQLLEETDEAGCTAVVVAALNDQHSAVKLLHERGAVLEAKCQSGATALMHAASKGNLETVQYLKSAGVDMYARLTPGGWSALTYAARNGHFKTLMFLHRLDLRLLDKWEGTPLGWAAATGDADMLEVMIKQAGRGGLDTPDIHGFGAAFWAAQTGNLDALKRLVDAGASLKMRSRGALTMLMAASFYGHVEVCAYLLDRHMPPDTKDASGWTAIMWAAASGQIDTVKLLETANADVKPKEGDWDPLMVAAANGHYHLVEWFLAKGLSFSNVNHKGKTASALARDNGHEVIAALIEKMNSINRLHADHQRKGRTDKPARDKFLRSKARQLAEKTPDGANDVSIEERQEMHFKKLVDKHADHERIAELRDVQRRHRRFLKTQREKELDQKKDQKKPDHMSLGIKEKLLSKMKSRDGAEL